MRGNESVRAAKMRAGVDLAVRGESRDYPLAAVKFHLRREGISGGGGRKNTNRAEWAFFGLPAELAAPRYVTIRP